VASYYVRQLEQVPLVPTDGPMDFDWRPIAHHLGLTAFGVNVFGGDDGTTLVHEHDESGSGQEELYVVMRGCARVRLAGDDVAVPAIGVVAIPDPAVVRSAVATADGTLLLAVGTPVRSGFESTWRAEHFEDVPRAD
jgi:hypothetical protein